MLTFIDNHYTGEKTITYKKIVDIIIIGISRGYDGYYKSIYSDIKNCDDADLTSCAHALEVDYKIDAAKS